MPPAAAPCGECMHAAACNCNAGTLPETLKKETQHSDSPEAPQVPTALPLEGVVAASRADIAARASPGSAGGPSVLLFTFLNTGHSLSCASFASDASHIAGAFLSLPARLGQWAPADTAACGLLFASQAWPCMGSNGPSVRS